MKKFWILACDYIKAKFPLKNEVLIHAKVADPSIRTEPGLKQSLIFMVRKFPCLLPAAVTRDMVIEQFTNYQCSDEVPKVIEGEDRVDCMWVKLAKVKDSMGIMQFQHLAKIMLNILTIPHSNASCERIFSCVRKNLTDQRSSLNHKTLESLLVVKSMPGETWDRKYDDKQLQAFKSAYYKSKSGKQ